MTGYCRLRTLRACHTRRYCCIKLKLSIDWEIRILLLGLLCCISHLIYCLALTGSVCGIAKECYLRIYIKDTGTFRCFSCDLDQIVFRRINIDRTIAHSKHFIITGSTWTNKNKTRRNQIISRFCLDQLQSRTNSICC